MEKNGEIIHHVSDNLIEFDDNLFLCVGNF